MRFSIGWVKIERILIYIVGWARVRLKPNGLGWVKINKYAYKLQARIELKLIWFGWGQKGHGSKIN